MDRTTGVAHSEDKLIPSHITFPVVGIGVSAGGLVALRRFFEHMPEKSGMAFVVVMHLSPKHESTADSILARVTKMPVRQVREATPVEANHVYLISPRNDLTMNDGYLRVAPAARPAGQHVAIDLFFRTLAEVHMDRAIAIVMSGTGSDGTVGLARVKELGGVTVAQSPDDAEYDDMPRNAIASGAVDFVLPVADMPQRLGELWNNARRIKLPSVPEAEDHIVPTAPDERPAAERALRDILDVLATRTGHDFRHYKRATVLRRIERRLQLNLLSNLPAYRDFLREHPEETAPLLEDMLISVTNFFRDREAFEAVEREIIPEIFANHSGDDPIRVWVPACATGEEAYSIAILLAEQAATLRTAPATQVFASDIDERALQIGRTGLYPEAIITDLPPARLRNFFGKEQHRYRINKAVRDTVLFATHNVLRDPPFSRLDMISCRNLLIYLDRDIQSRLLEMFHFALKPGGVLFLGSSESADAATRHFEVVDKKNRVYRARELSRTTHPLNSMLPQGYERQAARPQAAARGTRREFSFADVHQRVLAHYAPPSVIVDREYNIVHMSERVGHFLRFVGGEPSANVLSMVHPELRMELRTALFQAVHTNKSIEARRVKIETGGKPSFVNMVARPFRDPEAAADFVLVVFDEVEDTMSTDAHLAAGDDRDAVLLRLEDELHSAKELLQATIEQSETSGEELKASNEELQAINEELRSATEELETGKEELQSVNEELITVNFELKTKVDELSKVNDDLQNFIGSTDIATVFVDAGMRIRRYTPRAQEIFNLLPGDVGRSLLDITHRLDYPDLAQDASAAFESLRPSEREVMSQDGRWFVARVLPYRTADNRIDGAVLSFVDVTGLRRTQEQVRLGDDQLKLAAARATEHSIIVFDGEGRISAWNSGAQHLFGYSAAEMLGETLERICLPEDAEAGALQKEMARADAEGSAHSERWCVRKDGSRIFCAGAVSPIHTDSLRGYVKISTDATHRMADAERTNAELTIALNQRAKAEAASALKDDFLAVMSHELKNPLNLISVNAELVARLPEVRNSKFAVQAFDTIRRAIRGQTKIIDDLLDMSRIRTGKLSLNFSLVDLASVVEGIVEVARADASTSALEIEFDPGNQPALVRADPTRLEQIVWNLLSNAIKFTHPGGTIRLQITPEERFCRLVVIDDGQGIEPSFLPRVFELFGQAPGRALSGKGGLGIGLALVREIVERHGGRIDAHSDGVGRGAMFTVWLPRPVPELPSFIAQDVSVTGMNWAGLRILMVDDSERAVDTLAQLLELEGAKPLKAYSGEQALRVLEAEQVDVLVSDVGMPDMDGYELMRRVRANPRFAALPAIAMTGFARDGDVRQAIEAGFTVHLSKPVLLDSLGDAVDRAMKAKDATAGTSG